MKIGPGVNSLLVSGSRVYIYSYITLFIYIKLQHPKGHIGDTGGETLGSGTFLLRVYVSVL